MHCVTVKRTIRHAVEQCEGGVMGKNSYDGETAEKNWGIVIEEKRFRTSSEKNPIARVESLSSRKRRGI